MISFDDFRKSLVIMQMNTFPRYKGDPRQQIIKSIFSIYKFIFDAQGKTPAYFSHNSFKPFRGNPEFVYYNLTFLDFDSKEKPENAQYDAIKVIEWANSYNIPNYVLFSGGKGFHVYLVWKPYYMPMTMENKDKLRAFFSYLKVELNLRTLDSHVAEFRRLSRIPYSNYVSGSGEVTDRYVIPADLNLSIDEIFEQSKNQEYIEVIPRGKIQKFTSFYDTLDIKDYEAELYDTSADTITYDIPQNAFTDYLTTIIPKMCIHNNLMTRNPKHIARFAGVIEAKRSGLSLEETQKLFDEMSSIFMWVDRGNIDIRRKQVNSVYNGKYYHPSCRKIRSEGLCVGKSCPIFCREFKEECKNGK